MTDWPSEQEATEHQRRLVVEHGALRAENERLRAALRIIAEKYLPAWPAAEELRKIAGEALK